MQNEIHIAGVLVHARPEVLDEVAARVAALPNAEVYAAQGGKLVVVCECDSGQAALDLIGEMRAWTGVRDVALVYQHAERAGEMARSIEETMPCR